jgi:predicted metal-dependent phosphoesterase TrpH
MTMVRFAAHVHSTWSYDGTCSLEEVASVFRRFGYDGVLMSEHSRTFDQERWEAYRAACQKASRGILLVPGIEYEDDSNTVHVLVWGDLPFIESHSSTGETLRGVRSHHGISVLAHPRRKDALDHVSAADRALLDGIETWNRRDDGWAPRLRARDVLADGPGLLDFVGLDFHRRLDFFPLALRLGVSGSLTNDAVFEALSTRRSSPEAFRLPAGRFYEGIPRTLLSGIDAGRRAVSRAAGIGV